MAVHSELSVTVLSQLWAKVLGSGSTGAVMQCYTVTVAVCHTGYVHEALPLVMQALLRSV